MKNMHKDSVRYRSRRRIISFAIVLYVIYVFASGVPVSLYRGFENIRVFPWGIWGMFSRGTPWHGRMLAAGTTVDDIKRDVPVLDFFPDTSHVALEGNRVMFGVFYKMPQYPELPQLFCSWLLERFNHDTYVPRARLKTLTISLAAWRVPPDMSLPPGRQRVYAVCNSDIVDNYE